MIKVHVHMDASNLTFTSLGSVAYAPEKYALVWKIKIFTGIDGLNKCHKRFNILMYFFHTDSSGFSTILFVVKNVISKYIYKKYLSPNN